MDFDLKFLSELIHNFAECFELPLVRSQSTVLLFELVERLFEKQSIESLQFGGLVVKRDLVDLYYFMTRQLEQAVLALD